MRKTRCFLLLLIVIFSTALTGCDGIAGGDRISEIQGAGHFSSYAGSEVKKVRGFVTVLSPDGFWMESTNPDDDPATSEGIFVMTEVVPSVKVGDEVSVDGVVNEMFPGGMSTKNLSVTQIKDPVVDIRSSGNDLPAPTIVGEGGRIPPSQVIDNDTNGEVSENTPFDPDEDGLDFYESLEGMRIQINDALVVGPTNGYKEIVVVGDLGTYAGVLSSRGGLVMQSDDFNPERIVLDDRLAATPFVNVGDYSEEPIIGVVDYEFGNFKILPSDEISFVSGGQPQVNPLSPTEDGQLRVVSYNVLNLAAPDTDRIQVLAEQIVNLLTSPDIIGLQEIQDNNGAPNMDGIAADQTYQGIIDAILAEGGPEYGFINIDPKAGNDGGESGGNIRVGFLYRLDSGLSLVDAPQGDAVTPVEILIEDGLPVLSLNPGRVDPKNRAFNDSRKPLVVQFIYQGESLFLINNHFISKGGDHPIFGEVQPPVFESEIQRSEQAQVVNDFVSELLAVDPDARVIVMGDLNDYQFAEPIVVLAGEILNDLILTLPIEEQYTYVYDGNSEVLDHILVSDLLINELVSFEILHINSELEYTAQFSDHDVLIATFAWE